MIRPFTSRLALLIKTKQNKSDRWRSTVNEQTECHSRSTQMSEDLLEHDERSFERPVDVNKKTRRMKTARTEYRTTSLFVMFIWHIECQILGQQSVDVLLLSEPEPVVHSSTSDICRSFGLIKCVSRWMNRIYETRKRKQNSSISFVRLFCSIVEIKIFDFHFRLNTSNQIFEADKQLFSIIDVRHWSNKDFRSKQVDLFSRSKETTPRRRSLQFNRQFRSKSTIPLDTKTFGYWRQCPIEVLVFIFSNIESREYHLFSCSSRPVMVDADLSPTSSSGSDVSTTTTTLSNDTYPTLCSHIQLCRCPSKDCVVHGNNSVPLDLTTDRNPTYGKTNLLLYYAHLERCRRHGTQIHENCSSSSTFESLHK